MYNFDEEVAGLCWVDLWSQQIYNLEGRKESAITT